MASNSVVLWAVWKVADWADRKVEWWVASKAVRKVARTAVRKVSIAVAPKVWSEADLRAGLRARGRVGLTVVEMEKTMVGLKVDEWGTMWVDNSADDLAG